MRHLSHPCNDALENQNWHEAGWSSCGKWMAKGQLSDNRDDVDCKSCLKNKPTKQFTVSFRG